MGKRKSKARVITKRAASVPTQFDCIFCNHAKTVECKLNPITNVGAIKCRVCNVTFRMEINHLHDPIDVYSEWIDQTEKANRPQDEAEDNTDEPSSNRDRERRSRRDRDEDDDDVGDDEPSRDRSRYGRDDREAEEDEEEDEDEDERRRAKQRVKRETRVKDDVDEREEEEEDAGDADDGY